MDDPTQVTLDEFKESIATLTYEELIAVDERVRMLANLALQNKREAEKIYLELDGALLAIMSERMRRNARRDNEPRTLQ